MYHARIGRTHTASDNSDCQGGGRKSALAQDSRSVVSAFDEFAAPVPCIERVTLIKPFAVMSRNSYSTPVTLPIGLAYLAAVLEAAGYPVTIIDGIGENIHHVYPSACGRFNLQGLTVEGIVERIPRDTKVIGLSMMFSQEWVEHKKLAASIRERFPQAHIVAGGEHATSIPGYVLRDCPAIDYVIAGEGEMAMLQLTHALYHGRSVEEIGGVSSLDSDGVLQSAGLSRRIMHIDELPRPSWHLCPVQNYFIDNFTMGIAKGRNMPILASRGCPYQCTFCSNPNMWTTRYKLRNVEDVISEIEWLIEKYEANSIDFFDLTAIVKKDWIMEFCKRLKARGISVVWQLPSGTRSEALDGEALQAIYDANCRYLVYAPESGSERTLKAIKKKLTIAKTIESIRTAVSIGQTVKVNFIIGFPHEHFYDVWKTVTLMFRMALIGVHDANLAIFTPYPGSEIYEQLIDDGTIPAVNDDYFANLILQFDFSVAKSYTPHLSGASLVVWRAIGQFGFYAISYAMRPWRAANLFKGIVRPGTRADNLFEQRIFDFFARRKLLR